MFAGISAHCRHTCVHDPRFSDTDQPVVGVSYQDALAFCGWLSAESGLEVVLPTEAQWEYAARGIDGRQHSWGAARPDPTRACFAEDAFDGRPAKVGSFPPGSGPFGTQDQAGNVWEWCLDTWDDMAYVKRARKGPGDALDPLVEEGESGTQAVRGGSWFFPPDDLRACRRSKSNADNRDDDLGFRVAVLATPRQQRDSEFFGQMGLSEGGGIFDAPRA